MTQARSSALAPLCGSVALGSPTPLRVGETQHRHRGVRCGQPIENHALPATGTGCRPATKLAGRPGKPIQRQVRSAASRRSSAIASSATAAGRHHQRPLHAESRR